MCSATLGRLFAALVAVVGFASAPNLHAGDHDGWRLDVLPSVVLPLSLDNDYTVDGQKASVDLDRDYAFDLLNLGGSLRFEARNDRVLYLLDGRFFLLDAENEGEAAGVSGAADPQVEHVSVDFGAGYRVVRAEIESDAFFSMDGLAGVRYSYQRQEFNAAGGGRIHASNDWLDPWVGGQIEFALGDRVTIAVRGDVGGFGWGTASDFTWNAIATLGVRIADPVSLRVGYLAYGIDYDRNDGDGSFAINALTHGPWVGMAFHF